MQRESVDRYLEKITINLKLKGCSPRTIESYIFFLRPFLELIDNPETISLEGMESFQASLVGRYSNKSRALAVSSLRFFFKRIVDRPDLFVKLEVPKKERKLPSVLSVQEIQRLIDSTDFSKSKLMIKLLYSSGLRVSELVNLKLKEIELDENIGWVRGGKGGKDRMFKIANALTKEIQNYMDKNPYNQYLFSKEKPISTRNVQQIVKKSAEKAGINKKVTPHTLRHSFATHLLDEGENLLVIQNLLGHESLDTTKIYTHISQEQIKKVVSPLDNLKK